MQTFAEMFNNSAGKPFEHRGRLLSLSVWLDVKSGDRLSIEFLKYTMEPVQGIGITAEDCRLRVGETVSKHIALWTDTAPDRVELEVVGETLPGRIALMNQWRDARFGTTLMGMNNAAMTVERDSDSTLVIRCSDGWGDPDFDDLVFRMALQSRPRESSTTSAVV